VSSKPIPAWSLTTEGADAIAHPPAWSETPTREWAIGGSTGSGVGVCILDSGVDGSHPNVEPLASAYFVELDEAGELEVKPDTDGDVVGHGTACASVVRLVAPGCELHSVRVLGTGAKGSGDVMFAGLRWAVEQGFQVINLSLSTTKKRFVEMLHEIADSAYFQRTILVASAHNMPVESYPWRFSSVISVGSHEGDALSWYANPNPPVEFFARGVDVDVAWAGGGTMRCTGNSFAAPHIAGVCALMLSKHPELTPFQLKSLLYLTAANVEAGG
jgi:subtilisin family serine protease